MRKIRFAENEYYHVYNRGVDKRVIFLDKDDYKRFVSLIYLANDDKKILLHSMKEWVFEDLVSGSKEEIVSVGAWCLMPNHFHFLIKEKTKNGISNFMKKLLGGYSMYFNKKYNRTGSLFEGPFKAEHVDNDIYLKYLFSYIHLNPIGVIDKGWKNKRIENINKAKSFLLEYEYSSLFDYLNNETRSHCKILSKSDFPKYNLSFKSMVGEWIDFSKK